MNCCSYQVGKEDPVNITDTGISPHSAIELKKEEHDNADNRIYRCKVNNSIDIILDLRVQSVGNRES